jgi:hypothetical protein
VLILRAVKTKGRAGWAVTESSNPSLDAGVVSRALLLGTQYARNAFRR